MVHPRNGHYTVEMTRLFTGGAIGKGSSPTDSPAAPPPCPPERLGLWVITGSVASATDELFACIQDKKSQSDHPGSIYCMCVLTPHLALQA